MRKNTKIKLNVEDLHPLTKESFKDLTYPKLDHSSSAISLVSTKELDTLVDSMDVEESHIDYAQFSVKLDPMLSRQVASQYQAPNSVIPTTVFAATESSPKVTKKAPPPIWNQDCEVAFQALKKAITSAPCLIIPDPWKPFTLYTDASDTSLGAILEQDGHPVAFWSRSLTLTQISKYSTYEGLSLMAAVKRWHHFIDNGQCTMCMCDNKGLCRILEQKTNLDRFQQKLITQIGGLNIALEHVKSEDQRSDAMTRDEDTVNHTSVHSIIERPFHSCKSPFHQEQRREEWRQAYLADSEWSPIYNFLTDKAVTGIKDPSLIKKLNCLSSGLIFRKDKYSPQQVQYVCVPYDKRRSLLEVAHDKSGHYGVKKTLFHLNNYYWHNKRQDVEQFCRSCSFCQVSKPSNKKEYGVPNPLIHPITPRQRIHIDIIGPLPQIDGFNEVLTVVDAFSRFCIAIPCSTTTNSAQFERIFTNFIVPNYGVVPTVITDKGSIFVSEHSRFVLGALGSSLQTSSAYHQQGNGTVEKVHTVINTLLRIMILESGKSWLNHLGLIVYQHNNTTHTATGLTPSQLHFNSWDPVNTMESHWQADNLPIISDKTSSGKMKVFFEQTAKLQNTVAKYNEQLLKIMQNKKAKNNISSEVGDEVWLRSSDFGKSEFNRLQPLRYGPFRILEKKSENTYILQLPPNCQIDPEIHVKRLEPYFTFHNLREKPFSVLSKPIKFDGDKVIISPTDRYLQVLTHQKKVMGKHITYISDHHTHNLKNSPKSKSYTCVTQLETGNPSPQTVQKVPLDHLVVGKAVHQSLWKYWILKGPTALPSKEKLISLNLQWVNELYEEEYHKARNKQP